jgi:hypothetical protein
MRQVFVQRFVRVHVSAPPLPIASIAPDPPGVGNTEYTHSANRGLCADLIYTHTFFPQSGFVLEMSCNAFAHSELEKQSTRIPHVVTMATENMYMKYR